MEIWHILFSKSSIELFITGIILYIVHILFVKPYLRMQQLKNECPNGTHVLFFPLFGGLFLKSMKAFKETGDSLN